MGGLGFTSVISSGSSLLLSSEIQSAIVEGSLPSTQLKVSTTYVHIQNCQFLSRAGVSVHLLSNGRGFRPCSASATSRSKLPVKRRSTDGTTLASLNGKAPVDKVEAQVREGSDEMDVPDTVLASIVEILKPKDKFRYHKVPKLKALRLKLNPSLVLQVLKHEEVSHIHAWKLFVWAKKQMGYRHTEETYNTMIRILCEMKKFTSIVFLMEDMYKEGLSLTPRTCLKVAKTFASAGLVERAIHALNHMHRLGNPPTTSHFNSMITVLLQSDRHFKAYIAYREMTSLGCQPDPYTFKILLRDFAAAGKVTLACKVFDEMEELGCEPDIETSSIIVGVLCQAQRLEDAVVVFRKVKQKVSRLNARVYNALLLGFTETKETDKALEILNEMQLLGYYCDFGAFATLTDLLVTNGREDDVERLLSVRADEGVRQPAQSP